MKILVSAYACRPGAGSEWHVGWTAVESLASKHKLVVLTHVFNRNDIERILSGLAWKDQVEFVYLGRLIPWKENRMMARIQDWLEIKRWTKEASCTARTLHKERRFDIGVHSTIATWRIPSPLAHAGVPWIWGPIGGGVDFPMRFIGLLGGSSKAFECMRAVANIISKHSHSLKRCAKDASLVLVNTPETYGVMRQLGTDKSRIRTLSQTFLTQSRLQTLSAPAKDWPASGDRIEIVAGGTLEGLKGVSLALHALAKCKAKGLNFHYRYLGRGSEMDHLRRLAEKLAISDDVTFGEWLEGGEYVHALHRAHLYLLPSLREGVPVTLMEAMAAGCVPIVAACGGPGLLVNQSCGQAIPVTDPATMIDALAAAILNLTGSPVELEKKSLAAVRHIAAEFADKNYCQGLDDALHVVRNESVAML